MYKLLLKILLLKEFDNLIDPDGVDQKDKIRGIILLLLRKSGSMKKSK